VLQIAKDNQQKPCLKRFTVSYLAQKCLKIEVKKSSRICSRSRSTRSTEYSVCIVAGGRSGRSFVAISSYVSYQQEAAAYQGSASKVNEAASGSEAGEAAASRSEAGEAAASRSEAGEAAASRSEAGDAEASEGAGSRAAASGQDPGGQGTQDIQRGWEQLLLLQRPVLQELDRYSNYIMVFFAFVSGCPEVGRWVAK
jgi:hypothetical protein